MFSVKQGSDGGFILRTSEIGYAWGIQYFYWNSVEEQFYAIARGDGVTPLCDPIMIGMPDPEWVKTLSEKAQKQLSDGWESYFPREAFPDMKPRLYGMCHYWENNGYDDSDWYQTVYNPDTGELTSVEVGTTRFANAMPYNYPRIDEDHPAYQVALEKLHDRVAAEIIGMVNSKAKIVPGETLVLSKAQSFAKREVCPKCNGTGEWVNPKREGDVRQCFACRGNGKGKALKGPGSRRKLPKGTRATIGSVWDTKDPYGRVNGTKGRFQLEDGEIVDISVTNWERELTPELESAIYQVASEFNNFSRGTFAHSRSSCEYWRLHKLPAMVCEAVSRTMSKSEAA